MFLNKYKVIGILGGMGPEATVDLYNHIINLTPAAKDQDHIPTLIFSNPKIPDRTASINAAESEKIIRYLQESARVLEKGNADFIVIPCNTAHKYFTEIQDVVRIPVINMIEETVNYIIEKFTDVKEVGLLGTTGTLKMKLYQEYLKRHNITAVIPDEKIQNEYVMKAIYDFIKAGKDINQAEMLLKEAIKSLKSPAQEKVIMGCTEIPLALKDSYGGVVLINPTKILAEIAVKQSLGTE